ncbi:MAG: hypothetical protein D6767_07200 [Candidatus Hydrogenedentota bacterium]|nr:MAG: hypothetical protein D6767_07200 [Candidatus Hydrogenedentota bacterium]
MKLVFLFSIIFLLVTSSIHSFTYQTHQNLAEEGLIYMEQYGTNQMRWAFEYLKAKANGRLYEPGTGSPSDVCYDYNDPNGHATGSQTTGNDNQCGIVGIGRAGGIGPDFFRDNWWDDATTWNYEFNAGFTRNNFTSWSHFINLLTVSDSGVILVTNNHNDYDGYSYNANYGFPGVGIDYTVATFMNNAWMTIDLPNCTDCTNKFTPQPNGNPAVDYKQNGSTTPVGAPGNGGKKSATANGSNYNCFSDVYTTGNCPDEGTDKDGNRGQDACCFFGVCNCWDPPPNPYQIPNVYPGAGHVTEGDEDWIIYEPADNTSTFFFQEMFLEGGTSRNYNSASSGTFESSAVSGRYYSLPGDDLKYLALVMHWAGDMNQQSHIWSTIGYNHGGYEEDVDVNYGPRIPGGNAASNYEDFNKIKAYANSRNLGHNATISQIFMEQAFHTYHVRLRTGYDTLTNTNAYTNAAKWAVNNAAAMIAILYEKGVLDLRKYR